MNKKNELRKTERRKREQLRRKKGTQKKIIVATSLIIIAVLSLAIAISIPSNQNDQIQNSEIATPSDVVSQTEVSIPLSEIGSNAKFYSYGSNGVEIRYFAVKGPDGNAHVAFVACDVCYDAKKGYRQNGDVMQCINCGNEYPIKSLGTENTAGGCWPSYLPIKIDGDDVIINISDLDDKRWMF
jgi:uncharacterized membrane protein